jgi:hypothetical protein
MATATSPTFVCRRRRGFPTVDRYPHHYRREGLFVAVGSTTAVDVGQQPVAYASLVFRPPIALLF